MSPKVVLYSSSVSFGANTRSHTSNIEYILESKGVKYELVDLSQNRERADEMVKVSGGERKLPQLHVDDKVSFQNPRGGIKSTRLFQTLSVRLGDPGARDRRRTAPSLHRNEGEID